MFLGLPLIMGCPKMSMILIWPYIINKTLLCWIGFNKLIFSKYFTTLGRMKTSMVKKSAITAFLTKSGLLHFVSHIASQSASFGGGRRAPFLATDINHHAASIKRQLSSQHHPSTTEGAGRERLLDPLLCIWVGCVGEVTPYWLIIVRCRN